MIVYYRLPGLLAALALVIYALLNLAMYKLIPVTLTLPGIAGFLLSTGMAVDANILIFERMKEELRWGRSLRTAVGGRLQPGLDIDPRLEPVHPDHLRDPDHVRPHLRRTGGDGLRRQPGHRCDDQHVHGGHRHADVHAGGVRQAERSEALREKRWLLGRLRERGRANMFRIVEKRRWYFLLSVLIIVPGLIAMIYSTATIGAALQAGD